MKPIFSPGLIVATPGALDLLEDAGETPQTYIARHITGDWGIVGRYAETTVTDRERRLGPLATPADAKLNRLAVDAGEGQGARVLSAYIVGDGRLWIITEGSGADRVTTLLLPEDY